MPSETGDSLVPGQSSAEGSAAAAVEEPISKSKDYVEGNNGNKEQNGHPPTPTSAEPQGDKTDKGTRTRKTSRTAEPFDQSEREEMERLLEELRGHLGIPSCVSYLAKTHLFLSDVPYPILGRRGHRQQLPFQCRQVRLFAFLLDNSDMSSEFYHCPSTINRTTTLIFLFSSQPGHSLVTLEICSSHTRIHGSGLCILHPTL